MTTCTMIVDCGMLGERELTISYKYYRGFRGSDYDPEESESASIYWIKFGGDSGIEVDLPDDFITNEVIPHCVADYNGEADYAAEAHADQIKEDRRLAA